MTTLTAYANTANIHTAGPFTVTGLDYHKLAAAGIDTAAKLAAFLLDLGAEVSVEPCGPCCTAVTGWWGAIGYDALMTH